MAQQDIPQAPKEPKKEDPKVIPQQPENDPARENPKPPLRDPDGKNDGDRRGSQTYEVFRQGNTSPDSSIAGKTQDARYDVNSSKTDLLN